MTKMLAVLLLLLQLLFVSVDATTNDAIACATFYNSQTGLNTQEQCAALRQYRNCLSLAEIGMDPSSAASFEQGFQFANQTLLTRGNDCSLYVAMPEINTQQGRIIMTSDVDVQVVVSGRATSLKQLAQTSDTQTVQLQQLQATLTTVNTSLTNQLTSAFNDAAVAASTAAAATSTSLQQIQSAAATTNANVAAVSGLVVAAQQSLASQANSISTLSSTLGDVQTAAATTNTNVAAVSGLVVAAQQSLASQATSISSLNNGLAQVTAQASTNTVNVAAISGLVVAAQQSIASTNTNAAALSTTVSTVASVANTNVAELAHISALVIAAHLNINISSGNITTLVTAVNQLQLQAGANTVNVAGISGLVVATQQSIALNTNSINALTTTVTQAQTSAAATSSNLAALSTAHSTTVSNAAAQSTLLAAVSVRASQAAADILTLSGGAPAGTTVAALSTAVSSGQASVAALSTATSASVTTLTTTVANLRGTGSSGATVEGLAAALSGLATGSSTNLASTAVRVDTVTSRLDLLVAQIQPVNAAISGTLTAFVAALSADSSTYRQTVVNPLSSSVSNMQSCLQRSPPTLYDSVNNRCFPNFGLSDVNECLTNNGGCAQICINTLGGRSCACNAPQYVLNTDNITCVCGSGYSGVGCANINECGTANGGCSQNCLDTAGSFSCSCNAGYVLGADNRTCLACAAGYTGTSCTPCAKGNYKSVSGTNVACTACPTGTTTSGTGSTSVNDCNRVYWMQVGTLSNWDTVLANYPDSQWEYGSVHNGDIQLAYYNSWNLGTRITLYPFYPQQDTTNGLTFGTQVFTRGLSGDSTTQWISHYYRVVAGSGADYMAGSNGVVDPPLYVRKLYNPWVSVGTLANFWAIYNNGTFNQLNHELGIAYNGQIRAAHGNGWDVGMRLSTYPFYPQGDSANSLTFGTAVFTYNLTGVAVNGWQQNYYDWPGNRYGGNGLSDTVSLFMRNRSAPWVFRGPVSALDSIRNQFPDTAFDLGMSHNGFVNGAFRNSWNSAKTDTRLYTIPFYPMGNAYNALQFGYSVWGKGLQDHQDNTFAYFHYYYTANTNGFSDAYWFSNGDVSVASIYTRTNRFPWVQVGNVSDIIYLRSIYPITEYEYGIRYKGDIQTTFWNGWNSGTRLTLYPIYPQGSVGTSFTMGTDIFTRGLNGAPNANLWYEASYMYPETFQTNDNIDNGVSIPVFVRPLSETPYPIGWGC